MSKNYSISVQVSVDADTSDEAERIVCETLSRFDPELNATSVRVYDPKTKSWGYQDCWRMC